MADTGNLIYPKTAAAPATTTAETAQGGDLTFQQALQQTGGDAEVRCHHPFTLQALWTELVKL